MGEAAHAHAAINADNTRASKEAPLLASQPEPHDPQDAISAHRVPLSADERRLVDGLIAVAARYYPRDEIRPNESPQAYDERYQSSPQTQRLRALVQEQRAKDQRWRAFVRDITRAMPEGFVVDLSTTPPFYPIPSHQVMITSVAPINEQYRTVVFRLSHMTPYYDYHESLRRADHTRIELHLQPGEKTKEVAALVQQRLSVHFPEYQWLPPHLCVVPVPELHAPNTMPKNVTLADLLFEEGYSG